MKTIQRIINKIKIKFDRSKNYNLVGVGFNLAKSFSKLDEYKNKINISFNIGNSIYSLSLHWGKCIPINVSEDFTLWKEGRVIFCFSDTETVQLRKNQKYTLSHVFWKNGGDGFLYPYVQLNEFDQKFSYEATRFIKQEDDFEE